MKILAFGAHPDDIEIFMYGFLAECKKRGDEIFMCVATDGALGTLFQKTDLKEIRNRETTMALEKLGIPYFFDFPDGYLRSQENAQYKISEYVRDLKPDLILTHDPNDYHPDHRALSFFLRNAAGFMFPLLYADTLMGINFKPDYFVEITNSFDEKIKSILFHKTQQPDKFVNAVKLLNRFRAAQCNAPEQCYAEAYRKGNNFPFSDIRMLIPNSPPIRQFYTLDSDGFI